MRTKLFLKQNMIVYLYPTLPFLLLRIWNLLFLIYLFIYFLFPSTTLRHDAHGLKCTITSSIYNF